MQLAVDPADEVPAEDEFANWVNRALQLSAHESWAGACVTIRVVTEAESAELNNRYRNKNAPTNVLAFPAGDTDPDSLALYLGDVIISYPQAEKQAAQAGHSLEAEIQLLVVHGVLHLLGYDHATQEEKSRMWAAQNAALAQIEKTAGPRGRKI